MPRKIEVLCLNNICTESDGITRKGNTAMLTGDEFKHYEAIGAVERTANVVEVGTHDGVENVDTYEPAIEGGDAE